MPAAWSQGTPRGKSRALGHLMSRGLAVEEGPANDSEIVASDVWGEQGQCHTMSQEKKVSEKEGASNSVKCC